MSYCLRCGWCCKSINPFNEEICPYLKDNLCSIYDKRPKVCRDHDDPTSRFCIVGMDVLKISYEQARDRYQMFDLKEWAEKENARIVGKTNE